MKRTADPCSTHEPVDKRQAPKPEKDDLLYAYECAADFLDAEEWPEDDGGRQVAAYREVARRLRATAARINARTKSALP